MSDSAFTVTGGGGGGNYSFISQGMASNSASIVFTGLDNSYVAYKIWLTGLVAGTNNATLQLRCSTDNGSTYDSGALYAYGWNDVNMATGTSASTGSASATKIFLFSGMSSTSTTPQNFDVTLFSPDTGIFAASYEGVGYSGNWYSYAGGGTYSVSTVNAVQFSMTSGNIASGTFTLYGINM